jgi:uncharacterized protein YndB with AHSA1/START domain
MATANDVGATTFTTPSDREIEVTRVFDAPRELVFAAWTKPEHLRNWMLGPGGWTMTVCEIDLRPGGAQRFVWRGRDGAEMEIRGEYREIDPPERLVTTESWGGDFADDQHARPDGGGRQDDEHDDHAVPLQGGARRGARDGDEGGHVRELRPAREVPEHDGLTRRHVCGPSSRTRTSCRRRIDMRLPNAAHESRRRVRDRLGGWFDYPALMRKLERAWDTRVPQ